MTWIFEQRAGCGSIVRAVLLSGVLAACGRSYGDTSVAEKNDKALAALMADGPLPDAMMPSTMPTGRPPRFCGGNSSGSDGGGVFEDGGVIVVSPPSMSGSGSSGPISTPGPVTGRPGSGPVSGPVPMLGGFSSGSAGASVPSVPMGSAGASAPSGPMGVTDAGVVGPPGGDAGADGGVDSGSCAEVPIGFWQFDDCTTFRTDLRDSSFQGHTAFRTVDLTCAAGQEGQAVSFAKAGDLVYAPDQPDFALDAGVTVAAWVKPDKLDGVRTLFRKRDDSNSAFALVINARNFQFVIRLASGRLATVSTPAKAGQWTHVAATYDGTFLRLYINGSEVKRAKAPGTIAKGVGPLLMGNDISGRRLVGLMDNAWFNTLAAPDTTIMELTCLHQPATLTVSPQVGPAVDAGTAVTYQMSVTNHNGASCQPIGFQSFVGTPQDFTANPSFAQVARLASGQTATLPFDVSSPDDAEPGSYELTFVLFDEQKFQNQFAQAQYVVAEPSGCHVSSTRELTIRDVSVVDDPVRTSLDGSASDPSTGAWSFGRLMQRLSPKDADAPDVTEAMLRTFLTPQTINGFSVDPRPAMDPVVLQPWPRQQDGKLDLARAPMRLLAIVDRLDLKDLARGKAGEGRLAYGVLDEFGQQMQFTVIFEYTLPANDEAQFREWADAFHALQALPFPSPAYNAALQAITDRFTARGAMPDRPNGSALIDIRTNEIQLSDVWQLREFHVSPTTGFMDPATLFLTPDSAFNFTDTLARFINANEAAILTETHDVPATFEGAPFQAGSVFNNFDSWSAPGIANPEARHKFSLNTCNGCHGAETGTPFLQINPRNPGEASVLAGFQTGITVFDPQTRQPRRLAELRRRRLLLESVVCPPEQP